MSASGERELCTFPLPQRVLEKLTGKGIMTVNELRAFGPDRGALGKAVGLQESVVGDVFGVVFADEPEPRPEHSTPTDGAGSEANPACPTPAPPAPPPPPPPLVALGGCSALQLLSQHQQHQQHIITLSQAMDGMLGGGVCVGQVTEFCGVPGIGKTQISMQLSLTAQIPTALHGTQGAVVFVDTEGSFSAQRVAEMAAKLRSQLAAIARKMGDDGGGDGGGGVGAAVPSLEQLLSHIHVYRVYDHIQQTALIRALPEIVVDLARHGPAVKLVVIDSIAFHFRYNLDDMGARSRLLHSFSQLLSNLAAHQHLAVVLINQVTTKITNGESQVVAALGESWAHACTNRVVLFWEDGRRHAHLYKSPCIPPSTVPFDIVGAGVRDINRTTRKRALSPPPAAPAADNPNPSLPPPLRPSPSQHPGPEPHSQPAPAAPQSDPQ